MKKYFCIILLLFSIISRPLSAQETKKKGSGFGIEAGVGYNTMNFTTDSIAGGDSAVSLHHFWLQPCVRVHYDIFLTHLGTNAVLKLKPFLGYYAFGGKQKPDDNGKYSVLSFATIEAGAGVTFDINDMFQITPVLKAAYIISATRRSVGQQAFPPHDIKTNYTAMTASAGLQLRFRIKHITIGAEGWYGLTNFNKAKGKYAKESNYCLLLGYEF
jgi:hypothetical protein